MDIVGVFLREMMSIVGYALLVAGIYKLFQISTDLGEIKQLLKDRARSTPPLVSPAPSPLAELRPSDDASAYAERLLRAVNAESHAVPPVPSATSEPR